MSRRKQRKINELLELEIESIGFEGISVARKDDMVYFVKGGIPGDKVSARLLFRRNRFIESMVENIITPSEFRVEPKCKHFGACGGCSWQNLDYNEQLKWKRQHVIDSFKRIGKIPVGEFLPTLESPMPYNYRNKMEFGFGPSRWLTKNEVNNEEDIENKHFALGLHIPGRWDKVIDVEDCHLVSPIASRILEVLRNTAIRLGVKAYHTKLQTGFLRDLAFRNSLATQEIMLTLLTTETKCDEDEQFLDWFENELPKLFPEITTLVHAINDTIKPIAIGTPRVIKGNGYITEEILGLQYRISPFSFFQTNSYQLDRFIGLILDFAEIKNESIIWDLYCGTGSITLPAAKLAKQIYGIEFVESSIADAKANAAINNITNAEFHCLDLHSKDAPAMLQSLPKPDIIILDPPRAGMQKNLVQNILEIAPKRIVYVSCNPATQARDCEIFSQKYIIEKVQPVDMFPQTYHVESVAFLRSSQ
jgi:23S rRNA (uracil1939-C5)-methyltransferase